MAGADERRQAKITVKGARRTLRAVERVESSAVVGVGAARQPTPWTYGIVRARVTTAIPTGTWASPSSAGRAQIRHKDSTGAWVDSGDPVVVWNDMTMPSSLPVNRVVKIAWIGGEWWLVSASCS